MRVGASVVVAAAMVTASLGFGGVGASPAFTYGKPRAWILVDAGTGNVLDAGNDRQALPPASLTKLLTALIAASQLQPGDNVVVSPTDAAEPPTKIDMHAGEVWPFQDALYALLLSSANDAAAAIAERVGGSLDGFSTLMQQAGATLGLADHPILQDPAGLDDAGDSVGGGNLMSARDIAIVARAVLNQPLLAHVVATNIYGFVGPDGTLHRLLNHNVMLRTYPGAIGMKTGYTSKAGEDLVAAARRGGRTLIAVVMGAPDLYVNAEQLLDEGFAMKPNPTAAGDVLPRVESLDPMLASSTALAPSSAGPLLPPPTHRHHGIGVLDIALLFVAAAFGGVAARRQQLEARRRRRAGEQLVAALSEVFSGR